jgi:3'(2'), 5'-bisphosphate nucleotidase
MPQAGAGEPPAPEAMAALLARAVGAAREAGAAILEVYDSAFSVASKQDDTPVTEADLQASRIITERLSGGPGDFPLLSEEGAAVPWEERRRWPVYWLVDPLDGTREFVARNDEFSVNIALIESGRPVLGLIYAPVFRLLYAGARGLGSWKIEDLAPAAGAAADTPGGTGGGSGAESGGGGPPAWGALAARGQRLQPAAGTREGPPRVVGSRSHQNDAFRDFVAGLRRSHPHLELFVAGSALKFCYLAEGRATIYPCFGRTMEWDTAAGQAICNQVGKKVYALKQGRPDTELVYNKQDLRTGPFIAR